MKEDSAKDHKDAQVAALLAASTIVAGSVFYWIIQIESVREMLALAYG
jgi:hypothetical protein